MRRPGPIASEPRLEQRDQLITATACAQRRQALTKCRLCEATLRHTFVDLGMSPLCESFLRAEQLNRMEPFYPLRAYVCDQCFLVQLEEYVPPEAIFTEYAYFSSYSQSWLSHAREYVDAIIDRLGLDEGHHVVELGSNDGYLLQYFVQRNIPVLGIEPAYNVAAVARQSGVPTLARFFGAQLAAELAAAGECADLLVANNVLAQAPNLHDFVEGMRRLLNPRGTVTIEVPHLLRLVEGNQFDTIYHEHFSYFSLLSVDTLLRAHDLVIFDVQELPTHGGSLRLYARHAADSMREITPRVHELHARELTAGLRGLEFYAHFGNRVVETKRLLLEQLVDLKNQGRSIIGYGAPGKGNTLLNYCGIRTDFLDYTVDRNPHKHGLFTPGTHIPILPPDAIAETRPSHILILPWNLKDEIVNQLQYVRKWGGRFIIAIPRVTIL